MMTDQPRDRARNAAEQQAWFVRHADYRHPDSYVNRDPAYFASECAAAFNNGTLATFERETPGFAAGVEAEHLGPIGRQLLRSLGRNLTPAPPASEVKPISGGQDGPVERLRGYRVQGRDGLYSVPMCAEDADAIADLENQVSVADEAISEILAASRIEQAKAAAAIAMLEAALDETKSQLDFLRIAVERDDPKAEILMRVTDVWKVADTALTNAAAKHPTGER